MKIGYLAKVIKLINIKKNKKLDIMKPEELRIGNYINDSNGKPQQIDEIIRHPSCERMYAHIIKFKGWGFKSGYVEDLKPIPITKQWLIDFNLIKKDSYNWYTILKIETPYDNIYIDLNLNDNLIYINSCKHRECMKPIKYIHQLQNLIFALKGKELILDNTALSKLTLNVKKK